MPDETRELWGVLVVGGDDMLRQHSIHAKQEDAIATAQGLLTSGRFAYVAQLPLPEKGEAT